MNYISTLSKIKRKGLFVLAISLLFNTFISAQLQIDLNIQEPTCNGYTNGSASATTTGGQEPYSYQWSGSSSTSNSVWGLTGGTYSVTVTDANGLEQAQSFTVNQPDVLSVAIDAAGGCNANEYLASVTGGTLAYSYSWNTGESTASIQNPAESLLMVTVTDAQGCSAVAVGNVVMPLQIDLQMADISCNGYTDGLGIVNASGGHAPYSYLWSNGSTESLINDFSEGSYSVTVTDSLGCTDTASGTIVNPPGTQVEIIKDPSCGTPTTITVVATGGVEPYMYMWGDDMSMDQDSFYVDFPAGTMYLCVMNANHCPHDVWVTASPGFELNGTVTDADCGTGGSIDLTPTMIIPPITYNWTGPVGFVDPHTEDLTNLEPGTYSVVATDLGGCTASFSTTVAGGGMGVVDFDYTFLNCDNNELEFQFVASPNDPNATYNWSFGGSQAVDTMQFSENPGTITLDVDFGNGCDATISKNLDFDVISVVGPADDTICIGENLDLEIQNNGGPVNYSWSPLSLINSGENTATPNINTTTEGDFDLIVQVTNDAGCLVTDSVMVRVVDGSGYTLDLDLIEYSQCRENKITLVNNNPNASDFYWVFPDGTTFTNDSLEYDFSETGEYEILLVPNDTTCAAPIPYYITVGFSPEADFSFDFIGCLDSIAFNDLSTTGSPIYDWTWEFPTEFKDENPVVPTGVFDLPTFEAKLTILFGNGCSLSVSKDITVNLIEDNILDTVVVCSDAGVYLNPGGNTSYQYTWTPSIGLDDTTSANPLANPASTQTYTVDIVDLSGADSCMVTKDITVVVAPVDVNAIGDTTVCDDATEVNLSATHTGAEFAWYDDPSLVTPISFDADVLVAAGTYYAVSTNDLGCVMVDTVNVISSPLAISLVQDNFTICSGENASLEVNPSGLDIEWYLDGVLVGTGSPMVVNPDVSGDYVAQATNAEGCQDSIVAYVDVSVVDLSITATKDTIFNTQSSELNATGGMITYSWTPDDGSLDNVNVANPIATPSATTTYTVQVTDANGCTAEESYTIVVSETLCGEPYIYLPNAFTPNGDHQNDVLYLRGLDLSEIHLYIYNRWGQQVFETRDQSYGWDGNFNGEPVVPDVYGYYLRVRCGNGEEYFKKGNISVLK